MRILYAGRSLLNPGGGGEISAYLLMEKLAQNHEVVALGAEAKENKEIHQNNIKFYEYTRLSTQSRKFPAHLRCILQERRFKKIVTEKINEINPELVILQNPACVDYEKISSNVKIVVFVRSLDWYGIEDNDVFGRKIYNIPFFLIRHRKNKKFLKKAGVVITNSHFLKKKVKNILGIESKVVYPFMDLENCKSSAENEGKYVTFMNLAEYKGGRIALGLAKRMPKYNFLFLEGPYPELDLKRKVEELKNVRVKKWTEDLSKAYQESKIVLMPSLWEEPFGRIVIEAGINGIPSIVSAKGGLPEAVGEGGIVVEEVEDIKKWKEAVEKLNKPQVYSELSQKAKENAEKFSFKNTFNKFCEVVKNNFNLDC